MRGLWAKWDVKRGRREVGEPAVLAETDTIAFAVGSAAAIRVISENIATV